MQHKALRLVLLEHFRMLNSIFIHYCGVARCGRCLSITLSSSIPYHTVPLRLFYRYSYSYSYSYP